MSKINPPFRADHVGSLLRTPATHGNVMTHEEQWAKLRHCVEVADSVWM